ncbi:MAG TPA: hypothetical protein VF841_10705 [Anaeromyxobacter sp.]
MTHAPWDPFAAAPVGPGERAAQRATSLPPPEPQRPAAGAGWEGASFAAGQDCGTRVAACLARLSALDLLDGARWWNRRAHRAMAAALVAYAEELESALDAASTGRGGDAVPGTRV